jgi:putative ABC transport system ATP-binding protein
MAALGIQVKAVSRKFQLGSEEVWALRDVDIEVAPREFLALIGRSGSGKTTLLNIVAGLDRPTSGEVHYDGKRIDNLSERELTLMRRRDTGFIFQSFGLLPLLSATENVELPLRIAGFGHSDRTKMAKRALDTVGLSRRANHRPYELSGGEQQRVAIARAVATQPKLILADEPTGELDSTTARVVFTLLRQLAREHDITVVTCTHDRLVMEMVDRVEELADGRVQPRDAQELLKHVRSRERSPFESAFVGSDHQSENGGAQAAASGLSSLVGADRTVFAKPETAKPATESEDGDPDSAERWARPESRK